MFTAIVLSDASKATCIARALSLGLIQPGQPVKCHHVTLAMGDASDRFTIGAERFVTVTHYGVKEGRVCAFKVAGAEDSRNGENAHVTIATFGDAKPRESNDITTWHPTAHFVLAGVVKVCK